MIEWTLQNAVYELALGYEPCNEIGSAMVADLERFLAEVRERPGRALIIHSRVRGGFSAGANLRELYEAVSARGGRDYEEDLRRFIDRIHTVMDSLDTLPMTTIGVVHGVCFGGGFELALTCDILIAERTSRFCFPELRLGIIPGFGGIPRLERDVGNGVVRDLLLTGRSINAKKALSIGLVSQTVAKGEGLAAARSTAAQAVKFDSDAMIAAKAFAKPVPKERLAAEKELFLRLARRPTLHKALQRFAESSDLRPYLP